MSPSECMWMTQPARRGLDVADKVVGDEHGANLHTEVFGVSHPLRAELDEALDDGGIEFLNHAEKAGEAGLIVGHVEDDVVVAAEVTESEEGVAVGQACRLEVARALSDERCEGDFRGGPWRLPVDMTAMIIGYPLWSKADRRG